MASGAKIVTGKTRQRAVNVDFKSLAVLGYDADNCYPQRIRDIIQASGVATRCTNLYARYVLGQEVLVAGNVAPKQVSELIKRSVTDYSMWYGFAVHVSYNALGEPTKYTHLPFEMARIGIEKKAGMLAIHPDWDRRDPNRTFTATDIKYCHPYDPSAAMEQIESCDGRDLIEKVRNYTGQVLYVTPDYMQYPLAHIDSILEDVITSAQIKLFKNKNIRTNFMASHMLVYKGEFEDDNAREEFIKTVEQFQGAEKAGNVMVVEAKDESAIPTLQPFTIQNNDKLWEFTERSVIESIVGQFNIPPVLAGILQAGKLGTANEINEAHEFYNGYTQTDRAHFEQIFTDLLQLPVTIVPKASIYQTTPAQ